jgi:hypothetical protein
MYPPLVTSLCRLVPKGGALVDGHYVPEGVSIIYSMLDLGHFIMLISFPDQGRIPPLCIVLVIFEFCLTRRIHPRPVARNRRPFQRG